MKNINLIWAVALVLIIASCGRPSASEEVKKAEEMETKATEKVEEVAVAVAPQVEKVALQKRTTQQLVDLIGQSNELTASQIASIQAMAAEYGFDNLSAEEQVDYIEKIRGRVLEE